MPEHQTADHPETTPDRQAYETPRLDPHDEWAVVTGLQTAVNIS